MNSTDPALNVDTPNPAGESPTERVATLAGETPVGEVGPTWVPRCANCGKPKPLLWRVKVDRCLPAYVKNPPRFCGECRDQYARMGFGDVYEPNVEPPAIPEKCPTCRFERLPLRPESAVAPPEVAIVNLCGCPLGMVAPPSPVPPQGLDQFTAWNDAQAALNATYEALRGAWVAERLSDSLVRRRRLSEAYRLTSTRLPEAVEKLRKTLEVK